MLCSAVSDALPSDPAELRAMIAALTAENARMAAENARIGAVLRAKEVLIAALEARIAKLRRQRFGRSSEKVEREIEQLELALEDLQVAAAESDAVPAAEDETDGEAVLDIGTPTDMAEPAAKPRRRPRVAPDTPRERRVIGPAATCPDCGGDMRIVGEDVGELVDLIAAKLKVIEIARPKASCRRCERMVQAPAPSRPIPRSMAGPGLLAHVLVSKFDDHIPLYRQSEVFARMGADIPDSTLVDWCGGGMKVLHPVIERIEQEVFAADLIHADDTPIRVLDRARRKAGLGKSVKQGRIWACVCDQRPWAGPAPPVVAYRFSPDRKGEHPTAHLAESAGILQGEEGQETVRGTVSPTNAYSSFRGLYETPQDGSPPQFREAACWAHLRRAFHDVWEATKSQIAREALDRIGKLYDVEREITGRSAEQRLAIRKKHSAPKVDAFKMWSEAQLVRIPGNGDLARAFRYALNRWPSFRLLLEDGRVAIDSNPAERAMRPIGVGRRNWLFAGSNTGGETLARAMTLIETAKMNGLDPQAYLADLLSRIHDHKANRLDELLPWNWTPHEQQKHAA
jgi:transposase